MKEQPTAKTKTNLKALNAERQLKDYSIALNNGEFNPKTKIKLIADINSDKDCGHGPNCTSCNNDKEHIKNKIDIEYIEKNIPYIPYVVWQLIMFIDYVGFRAESDEDSKKLKKFMSSYNIQGVSNHIVWLQAMYQMFVYGQCGLRFLSEEDGLILYKKPFYSVSVGASTEYQTIDIPLWINLFRYPQSVSVENLNTGVEYKNGLTIEEQKQIIIDGLDEYSQELLPSEKFLNLRFDPTQFESDSPLNFEGQRLTLLATYFQAVIDKLNESGLGRILGTMRDDFSSFDNLNTDDLVASDDSARKEFEKSLKKAQQKFAELVATSKSDSVIITPPFLEGTQRLENTNEPKDFNELLDIAGTIVSEIYSVPPILLGLGNLSDRNISVATLTELSESTSIKVFRDRVISQLNTLLKPNLNIGEFDYNIIKEKTSEETAEYESEVLANAQVLFDIFGETQGRDLAKKYLADKEVAL